MVRRIGATSLAVGTLFLAACDIDFTNPNAPTTQEALNTQEGLFAATVGMQARYGNTFDSFVFPAGLLTGELGSTSGSLPSYRQTEVGVVEDNSAAASDFWSSHYLAMKSTIDIIDNVDNVTLAAGTRSGMLALAYTIKAALIGQLVQGYQQVVVDPVANGESQFVDRTTALARVQALLDSAEAALAVAPASAEFTNAILVRGLNLPQFILSQRARYSRLSNDWPRALAAANAVSRTTVNVFPFSANAVNPLLNLTIYVRPADAWRLSADPADTLRTRFHVRDSTLAGFLQPLDNYGRFVVAGDPIPVWWPDEMRLIAAEALLETGALAQAQTVLDSVRVDCTGPATQPRGCLPALTGSLSAAELRAEIYRQRRFELFATGLSWEDARRLNQVGTTITNPIAQTSTAQRCWLQYPLIERNANSSVPPSPEGDNPPAFPASCS